MDDDQLVPDHTAAGAQQTNARHEGEPEPMRMPEPEPEPEPESGVHRHEGWLSTDAGVRGAKRKKYWHALTASLKLVWFRDKDARTLFDELDRDRSGALDIDEIGELCKALGKSQTKKEIEAAREAMDVDGSGEISFEEFEPWWDAENAKAAKKRAAVGSFDLSRFCEASLDPGDDRKETLEVVIAGDRLSLQAENEAAAKQWMVAFTGVTATVTPGGAGVANTKLSASSRGHKSSPIVSETPSPRSVENSQDVARQTGPDHEHEGRSSVDDEENERFIDDDEHERRQLAARKRGRRNADPGTLLGSRPSHSDDDHSRRGWAQVHSDEESTSLQPRDGERERHSHRRKHGKHRSSPKRRRSRSRHRRSSSRLSRSERRDVDVGLPREGRGHEVLYEARRARYSDAPRYSDSHHATSKKAWHENHVAFPKGTPAPAIPLRTHTREYEYPRNGTKSSYGSSVAEQLDLGDDWQAHAERRAMSGPMLVGTGAVVARGPNPGSHMLAEFRESFLPIEQRYEIGHREERAVIIEPGAEADLNKYLRHGWRVKSTQPGADNAFLVIVEREEAR